jgi:cell wall-associated NlpC family hydrolase
MLVTACASTGARPRPFPTPGGATVPIVKTQPTAPVPPVDVASVTDTALALRGAPYRNGGSTPAGFDCSGFTQYVFGQHGLYLPRDVKDQFAAGTPIRQSEISAGDLLFFSTVARGASHVGIALEGGEFVHAPSSNGVVRVERLDAAYWSRRFVGARRLSSD